MIFNNIPVFAAMMRNRNSTFMNRAMIGYTLKQRFGPFTQKEIDDYVYATLDDISKYHGKLSPAPPFFFSKELYPMFKKIITHRDLGVDLIRMVHGYQGLNCYDLIERDDVIDVEMRIEDITDTSAGEILRIVTRAYKEGELVIEGDTGFVVRRKRHIDSDDVGNKNSEEYSFITGDDDEIKILIKTEAGQEKRYAKGSNDTNPIHTSRLFARLAGLPGTILHGVCVIAMCTNSLIDNLAQREIKRLSSVSGRFAYPVIPGDTLTLKGRRFFRNGRKEVSFNVFSSKGKAVVKKGLFSYI
jgi:acyl dehydratase